jgi:hypothetical protein
MTTSEKILHEQFSAVWRGLGEVEKQVGEEAILDEVLTHLDLKDPPPPLRPAAAVLQAIEDEIQPGGARAWPGRTLSAERRRELAIILFLHLFERELAGLRERLQARLDALQKEPARSS